MYYALKENAYKEMKELGKGNLAELKDIFLIDDKLNVRYISKDGKTYGDEVEKKILEDTTPIRFASKEFSAYISKILGIEEDKMTFELMKKQKSLTINDSNITSLSDLIFFPNLTYINMQNIKLDNLDGIENCKSLKFFSVVDVEIEDYTKFATLNNIENIYIQGKVSIKNSSNFINSIKNFQKLKSLSLYFTYLENIDLLNELKNKETVTRLNLGINKIKDLKPLQDFNNLEYLDLSNNEIEDISALSNLSKLNTLYLRNNHISDITPLSNNTSLMSLVLIGNKEIDGNKNNYTEGKLEKLDKIGEILDRGGDIQLDIDKLGLFTNYKKLELTKQKIKNLEQLEGLTQLTSLNLSDNELTLTDDLSKGILSKMVNLQILKLSNNNITDIKALNNLKNLKTLYLTGTNNKVDLKEIEDIISNLTDFRVSTENLKTIVNCEKIKIKKLYLNSINELPDLSSFSFLKVLSLTYSKDMKNFNEISKIKSLSELNLSNNDLHGRMINFTNLKNLTNLDLSNNTLWDEDLENLKALKDREDVTINLSNNSIREATALLELNQNTKIILSGNVNLTENAKTKLRNHFKNNVTF